MIPTIPPSSNTFETIIEGFNSGDYTKQQAVGLLHQLAEDTGRCLRDEFAMYAPNPSEDDIHRVEERERLANPHNEPYFNKVRRRGRTEIICALRYEYADAMIAQRSK